MNKIIKVFILGSSVSRDPFELADEKDFQIVGYIARTSFASFASKPYVDQKIIENIPSPWQQKMVLNDMSKTTFKKILNSSFDVLLIDLIDERLNLSIFNEYIHTLSSEYKKALYRPNQYHIIERFSEEKFELWKKGFQKFIDFIKTNSLEDKVLLNRLYWTRKVGEEKVLNENYTQEIIDKVNADLDRMYDHFIKNLPNTKVINYPEPIVYSDPQHKWGLEAFHYNKLMFKWQLDYIFKAYGKFCIKYRNEIVAFSFPIDWRFRDVKYKNLIHNMISLRWLNEKNTDFSIIIILRDFYNFHVRRNISNPSYSSLRGDHSASIRLRKLLYFYNYFEYKHNLEGRGICHKLIVAELKNMQRDEMYRKGHNHALMLLNSLLECFLECKIYRNYINIDKICARFNETLKIMWDNGVTTEHSVSYQEYNYLITLESIELLEKLNIKSIISKDKLIGETKLLLNAFVRNNGEYIPLGDSFRAIKYSQLEQKGIFIEKEKGNNLEIYANKHFFVFKNNHTHFATTCTWNSNHHKQNDELSFVFEVDNNIFFDDPGYTDFADKDVIDFLQSEIAHSTITIEDISWNDKIKSNSKSIINSYQYSQDGFEVYSECERIENVFMKRKFILNKHLLTIEDEILFKDNSYFGKNIYFSFVLNPNIIFSQPKDGKITLKDLSNREVGFNFGQYLKCKIVKIPYVAFDLSKKMNTNKIILCDIITDSIILNKVEINF